jgi:raffinose/stachyose/melibiose transport system substrate-binding protein
MKSIRSLVIIIAALVLLFAALAGTSAMAARPSPEEEISGDFVYWALWNEGEPQQQVFAEMISAFQEKYPNVNVQVTWAGREVLTKARSALMAGAQLDLVDQAADELNAAFIKNDLAMPLDDLLAENALGEEVAFKDIFVPGVLEPYKWKGQVVFIPYEIITSAYWYDENFFKEYNLTVPKTWDEMMQMCETLKAQGKACIAQDGTADIYNAYYWYWLSARIMGPGAWYAAVSDPTGAAWDDPGWLEVAKKVQEPAQKGYFMSGWDGSVWPAAQVAWSQGEAAILLCGSWIPNETGKTAKPDFKYRGFVFPEVTGGKGKATEVESYLLGWLIPSSAKNPAAAKAFIKFAMQQEWQQKIVEVGQNMVARKDVPLPDVLPDMKAWFDTATALHKPYDGVQADHPGWWATIFLPLDDQLIKLQITPEDFIATIKARTIEYWAKPTPTPAALR